MKISARNILKGKVVDVRKDTVAAQIQVDIAAATSSLRRSPRIRPSGWRSRRGRTSPSSSRRAT